MKEKRKISTFYHSALVSYWASNIQYTVLEKHYTGSCQYYQNQLKKAVVCSELRNAFASSVPIYISCPTTFKSWVVSLVLHTFF